MTDNAMIRSALFNLSNQSGSPPIYAKGVLVGIVACMMSDGVSFEIAVKTLHPLFPKDVNPDAIPEAWKTFISTLG